MIAIDEIKAGLAAIYDAFERRTTEFKKDAVCRPFSCRRLYSLRRCSDGGPMVHRQAMAVARQTIIEIQHLDKNGYSGHHSFILYLLDQQEFRSFYRSGGFEPQKIMQFGKSHGIVINRAMVNSGATPDGKSVR